MDELARGLTTPPNPLAAKLGCGYVLTDENGARYVIVGLVNDALRICRLPDGMTIYDVGRKIRHAPTPDDPAASEAVPT